MDKVQGFMDLPRCVTGDNFVFNSTKGFYCVINYKGEEVCLDSNKGTSRYSSFFYISYYVILKKGRWAKILDRNGRRTGKFVRPLQSWAFQTRDKCILAFPYRHYLIQYLFIKLLYNCQFTSIINNKHHQLSNIISDFIFLDFTGSNTLTLKATMNRSRLSTNLTLKPSSIFIVALFAVAILSLSEWSQN